MRRERFPAIVAVVRLRAALERSASAMAAGRLDELLAAESALDDALTALPSHSDLAANDRDALRAELDGARRALRRCQRLGANLTEYVRLTLHARGSASGYEPERAAASVLGGRALNATG